ncbi:MAG: hypothetical protein ACLFVJ_04600 [Persicimonas sp.]
MDFFERVLKAPRLRAAFSTVLVAAICSGCINDYDFERADYERGTLGEELYGIWHKDAKRAAENAESKTEMLEQRQHDFVAAIDTIAPPETLEQVDYFLRDLMGLVDDGLVPALTRKLEIILAEAAGDRELVEALAIQNRPHPEDFLSPVNGKNFIGHLMGYDRLADVATRTSEVLLAADGVTRQGLTDTDESSALSDMLSSAETSLADTERIEPTDSLAFSMQKVLIAEDARFMPPEPTSPHYAVVYDKRGFPKVRKNSSGELPAPFIDADEDGLADVNSRGEYLTTTGETREVPAFQTSPDPQALLSRDQYGRGSSADGDYVFEYIDVNQTGLHFVTRQLGELAAHGPLWDLVDAAPALLGPLVAKQDDRGAYRGYSADNPITDMGYAMLHMLDIDQLDEVLGSMAEFLDSSSSELAGVIFALDEAVELMDEHPDAQMADDQTIAYDLLPLLEKISADPELWRDFFWALRQPIARHTGEPMQQLLEYKDQNPSVPALDGPYDTCFKNCRDTYPIFDEYDESTQESCVDRYQPQQALERYECIRSCPDSEIFSQAMDFDAPESEENRSMFQRLFHLLRDTAGMPYALEITEPSSLADMPPLVHLDGSAEAFLRSVGSTLDLADFVPDMGGLQPLIDLIGGSDSIASILSTLSPVFGVRLDRRATPDQITRLFNFDELSGELPVVGTISIDPPVCKDDYKMANHHADILYASEASGLIDTIAPLSCAFSRHDKEALLAEMFVVIHEHYSSRTDLYQTAQGNDSPMKGANMVSYEPALRDVLERGTLFDALYRLSVAADDLKGDNDADFTEQLRLLVHNATRTDDGFEGRSGEQSVTRPDDREEYDLSRMHVMMDAAGEMADRVEDDPEAKQALEDMMSSMYTVMLDTEWPEGEDPRFVEEGTGALTARLTRHMADRAADEREQGRLSEWLTQEQVDNVESMWDSRMMPALVDLSEDLAANPENRELADDLFDHLIGAPDGRNQAAMAAYVLMVYTLQQDVWVPLSHFLSGVIDPDRDWGVEPMGKLPLASHVLQVLHDTVEQDPEGRGLDLFERGFSNRSDGTVPFATVGGVIADYFRVDPASDEPYTPEDYERVFGELASWVGDDVHGLEQLYDIVSTRVD